MPSTFRITIEPVTGRKARGGTLAAAKTFTGQDQVSFGREPTRDIVFPNDDVRVGRTHGRFVREPSGYYSVKLDGPYRVEINGRQAHNGDFLYDGDVVRLGDGGPAFRARVEKVRGLRQTISGALQTVVDRLPAIGEQIARQRRAIAAVAVALIIVAAGLGIWNRIQDRQIEESFAALETALAERTADHFPEAVRQRLHAAAYAVIVKNSAGFEDLAGTAWPFGPGMLATNAHVANLKPATGETMLVRPPAGSPENLTDHKVIGTAAHPAYAAFGAFLVKAKAQSPDFRTMGAEIPVAYDVGILYVNESAELAPALEIERDAPLAPGDAIALVGYGVRGTVQERSAHIDPTPFFRSGEVSALNNFFYLGADKASADLIQHGLAVTGGSSGSAVVNTDGKVVAILNRGTTLEDGRTPSAAMVNFAQRAGLLDAIVDPDSFDPKATEAAWWRSVNAYREHETALVRDAQSALRAATGSEGIAQERKETAALDGDGAVRRGIEVVRDHALPVEAGRTYTLLVYGERAGSLGFEVRHEDDSVLSFARPDLPFKIHTFTAEKSETLQLRVVGGSSNPVAYTLHVFSAKAPAA